MGRNKKEREDGKRIMGISRTLMMVVVVVNMIKMKMMVTVTNMMKMTMLVIIVV